MDRQDLTLQGGSNMTGPEFFQRSGSILMPF
jgi:hypothetical protein